MFIHLAAGLTVDRPPVALHQAVVRRLQGLAVPRQTGPGLRVPLEAVVLHHAGQQGHEVRILTSLAAHPAGEATLGVSGLTGAQAVEDVPTLGVRHAGGELAQAVSQDTHRPLAVCTRHDAGQEQH